LNSLVHPAVEIDFEHWCSKANFGTYVLKEAALIVESDSYKKLDAVITVVAPESLRIRRVLQRDSHRTLEDIRAIISRQLDDQKKIEVSKFVVVNDETTLLLPQVLKIHEYFNNLRQTG
jgi:dephospho-CoA kinase